MTLDEELKAIEERIPHHRECFSCGHNMPRLVAALRLAIAQRDALYIDTIGGVEIQQDADNAAIIRALRGEA